MVVIKNVTIGNTKTKRAISIDTVLEDDKTISIRSTFMGLDRNNENRQMEVRLTAEEAMYYSGFLHDVARGLEECEEKEYESK
jgi:hypothetical protein